LVGVKIWLPRHLVEVKKYINNYFKCDYFPEIMFLKNLGMFLKCSWIVLGFFFQKSVATLFLFTFHWMGLQTGKPHIVHLIKPLKPLDTIVPWCLRGFREDQVRGTPVSRTAVRLIVVNFPVWMGVFTVLQIYC